MPNFADAYFELNRVFDALNVHYFNNELPNVALVIQSNYVTDCKGWFYPEKWEDNNGNTYHEVSISSEYLNREPIKIMETLQHQLIHVYCYENGIKDVSRNFKYHNEKYKNEAGKRGLICEKDGYWGWIQAGFSEEFGSFIAGLSVRNVFNIGRKPGRIPPPTL